LRSTVGGAYLRVILWYEAIRLLFISFSQRLAGFTVRPFHL